MSGATDPGQVHPIAKAALAVLKADGRGTLTVDVDGRARIAKALAAYSEPRQLKAAVKELICFAWFLENKRKAPGAARALLDVAESAAEALLKAGESVYVDDDEMQRRARQYQKLMGTDSAAHVAPHVDDANDEDLDGTVKAGFLGVTRGRIS